MTMDSNGVEAAGVLAEHELKTLLKDGAQAFDADSESEAEYETASDTPEDATESETEPDVDVVAKDTEKAGPSVVVEAVGVTMTTTSTTIKAATAAATVVHKESNTDALYPSVRRLLHSRPELRAHQSDALYPTVQRLVHRVAPKATVAAVERVTLAVETPVIAASTVEAVVATTVVESAAEASSEAKTEVAAFHKTITVESAAVEEVKTETTIATEVHTKTEVTVEETVEVHSVTSATEASTSVEVTDEVVMEKHDVEENSRVDGSIEKTVADVVVEEVAVDVAVESAVAEVAVDKVAKGTVADVTAEKTSEVPTEKAAEQASIDVTVQKAAEETTVDVVTENVVEEVIEKSAVDVVVESVAEKVVAEVTVEKSIDNEVEKAFDAKVESAVETTDHVDSTQHEEASIDVAVKKAEQEDIVESFVESTAGVIEEKINEAAVEATSEDAVEAKDTEDDVTEKTVGVVADHAATSVVTKITVNSADTTVVHVEKMVEVDTVKKTSCEAVVESVKVAVESTENATKAVAESETAVTKETNVDVKVDVQVKDELIARINDSLYPSVMKLVTVKVDIVPAPPAEDMVESLETIAQKTDSLYPSVLRLVLAKAENASAVGADIPPPALAATPVKPARKSFGLGSFLPKVPSILRKDSHRKVVSEQQNSTASSRSSHHSDENDGEQDGVPSLTEQPAKETTHVPLATRLRGLSIEASSIVRKFNGLRSTSSIGESPRNSLDGMPPLPQRRSLTSGNNSPIQETEPETKVQRGACVATKFGTGTVLDIRPDDGFYVVQLVPKGIAYLREEMIVREIKSIVGERVKTRWGLATVEQYFVDEDMYSIALDWRWDDDHVWRMKATTKKFEKISRSMSIVQNTKARFFEGYSTFRESASSGYANVAAKLNTTHKRPPQLPPQHPPQPPAQERRAPSGNLGRALTPYGVCSVIEVRPDQFFVVETKCGATAYLNAESVKLLHRRTNFSAGDKVRTPYGNGEIVLYREEDEVYEVKVNTTSSVDSSAPVLYITDAQAEALLSPLTAPTTVNRRLSTIFNMTRNSVFNASATVKASATEKLNTLSSVKSKMTTMAAIKMTKVKFQKGERVITAFGSGFVDEVRPLERIYEVKLRRLNTRGHFHESVLQAFPYERVTHFIVDGKTIPAPEMPKNLPEYKRRHIINEAVRQARKGL